MMAYTTDEIQAESRRPKSVSCAFMYPQHPDGTPAKGSTGIVQFIDGNRFGGYSDGDRHATLCAQFIEKDGLWHPAYATIEDPMLYDRTRAFCRGLIAHRLTATDE